MSPHYTATAKALHWGIAVLIFGMLALGFYMTGLDLSPTKLQLFSWHKWAGVTVFMLVVVRLVWRVGTSRRRCPRTCRRWNASPRTPVITCSTC